MDVDTKSVQEKLFHIAKKSLGDKGLLLWVQEHLNLSQSSAYRRINCQTDLTFRELMYTIKYFNIPTNQIFDSPDNLIYFYLENNKPNSYEQWMEGTYHNFSTVCSSPNVLMHYTSTENQIFYHFHFKELTYFKLYIWAKSMWHISTGKKELFDLNSDLWTPKVDEYRLKMLETYTRLPSIEFWTPNIMNNNLSQIGYYLTCGKFANPEDALLLCHQLREMMELLLEQTKTEQKVQIEGVEQTSSFELYYNELIHTNNTLLFTSDKTNALYTTFGNPTTIKTEQDSACNYALEWFENLKVISQKISYSSQKDRLRIMDKIETKLLKAEKVFSGLV